MKTRECDVGGAVRLPKQFYERPLTLEESRFASEHNGPTVGRRYEWIIFLSLTVRCLPLIGFS